MGTPIPSTVVEDAGKLYVAERKVYPREVRGRFQRLRTLAVWTLLGMFYLFPWLGWDGRQAVLFDLPARRFYVFGLNFWPQDFFLLALLLMIAGLSLFFFTALAGRLWCGYACPQTVWTEVFLRIERFFEGDRARRMKLDAAPWSGDKLLRKGSKHAAWLVLALWTGFTFVGFFTPVRELGTHMWPIADRWMWGGWETFWVLFYALATWGNAGFLREQVCKYMCPYARFQSAMFDANTLVIAYDPMRGEPRGPRKRGALASVLQRARGLLSPAQAQTEVVAAYHRGLQRHAEAPRASSGLLDLIPEAAALAASGPPAATAAPAPPPDALGDCIDCTICVQVCPTGIDIRNGLQYECIACGACIDACDAVMDRIGYPRGLVSYTTQAAVEGRPARLLRARVFVYAALLALMLGGFAWGVASRSPLIVDVLRDRNALYREAADGAVENAYTLKLVNKSQSPHRYRIAVDGHPAVAFAGPPPIVDASAEEVITVPVTLRAAPGALTGRTDIHFTVQSTNDPTIQVTEQTRFFAPTH